MARRRRRRRFQSTRVTRFSVARAMPHLGLLAASGLLLMLAFPRPGLWWLAHVALAPMALLAMRAASAKRLAWTSYVAGALWWLIMLAWMPRVTFGGYVLISLVYALTWPAALLAFRILSRNLGMAATAALPLAWVTFEAIRGYVPMGGFDWFALAYTQAPYLPGSGAVRLIQIADVFGHYSISFIVAMSSGLVVDALNRPWIYAAGRRRRISRQLMRPAIAWLLVVVGSLMYGNHRIKQTPDPRVADAVNVAVVQTNVPQDNKITPTDESTARNWRDMLLQINAAATDKIKPDLIVCPETMAPAALNDEAMRYYAQAPTSERGYDQFGRQLRALATTLDTPLVIGAHAKYDFRRFDDDEGKTYIMPARRFNAAFLIKPHETSEPQFYAKVHRVPFGEYLPGVERVPALKQLFIDYISPYPFDYSLTKGESLNILQMDGKPAVRIIAPICYEVAVSRLVRQMAYTTGGGKRADVIVNLTNDGWYTGTAEGPQHMQMATLRCVENRLPMARSVNTGISALVDSAGRVSAIVTDGRRYQGLEGYAAAALAIDERRTVFGLVGMWPTVALVLLTGVLVLAGWTRR